MLDAPASNIPEYTVSEISGAVKRTLEGAFARVRVRGEVTECKRYPSGHIYLSLKDEGGKIAAVVWKSAVARLGLKPENGVEVVATGRVTGYAERSVYQLVIERLEYAGIGALLARIERLRLALAAEGLFDDARKRPIPRLPDLVGVVTSESGAVLHDIRTTIARRFPRPILVWPVPVQGEGAAARIAAAIEGFSRLPTSGPEVTITGPLRPDVLIVARGGGSLEDLMAFNEEVVLRAAAACSIPLISAVGHETDTTLIDHVADRRAPTPTAAAEMAVPSRLELMADLQHRAARLAGGLRQLTQAWRLRLGQAAGALPDLPSLAGTARQRLDDRAARLTLALPQFAAARRAALVAAERHMPDPRALLAARRSVVTIAGNTLRAALRHGVTARHAEAQKIMARLTLAGVQARLREARAVLGGLSARIPDPDALLAARRSAITIAGNQLHAALRHGVARCDADAHKVMARLTSAGMQARLREKRAVLDGLDGRLRSVSYEAVLARGYALVLDTKQHALTSAAAVAPDARLILRFSDGEVKARALGAPAQRQGLLPL